MPTETHSDFYIATDHETEPMAGSLNSNLTGPSYTPATHTVPGSGQLSFDDESPYFDFDNDGEFDDSFELDPNARMIGDLPGGEHLPPNDELHDKRKSIDGKDDDNEGGGKRREGEDRTGKKPGRKPLTSEPTTKRKAQNRAAQRAFRERKEKHLRDLETKVEDLEKTSEATNHENSLLRAQVERLQVELKEYRKRLSWISSGGASRSNSVNLGPQNRLGSFNQQSDFQFEFPKFGDMPQLSSPTSESVNGSHKNKSTSNQRSKDISQSRTGSTTSANGNVLPATGTASPLSSPTSRTQTQTKAPNPTKVNQSPRTTNDLTASPLLATQHGSVDSLTGLFSPSILESARHGSFSSYFPKAQPTAQNAAVSSSSQSNTNSPSSSTDSQHNASSIGTSPEPSLNSPANKVLDAATTLNPINETQDESSAFGKDELCRELSVTCGCSEDPIPPILNMGLKTSNELTLGFGTTPISTADPTAADLNPNSFNLIASQSSHSAFDPVLFGDYRETQDSILSQDFGSFFNDAYPLPDLGSPTHNFNDVSPDLTVPSTQPARPSLLKQVEAAREGNNAEGEEEEVVPDNDKPLSCNKIWDRLQSMEKFRNGEIDIDSLCSELRAKAKCSEGGAVVDKRDVDRILGRAS